MFRVLPSVALSTMTLLPVAAAHPAARSAVMLPLVLTMFVIVMFGGTVIAVTVILPGAPTSSVTTAICELVAGLPCVRDNPTVGVIVGGPVITCGLPVRLPVDVLKFVSPLYTALIV